MTASTGFERDNQGLFIRKDPESVMDYTIDYTNMLVDGATISSHTVTPDSGITKDSSSIVSGNKKITMTLSGGTVNTVYTIKLTVVTSASYTIVRRFRVKCEQIHL